MTTDNSVENHMFSARWLDACIGFAFASFVFIPGLRAITGLNDVVYAVPITFLVFTVFISSPTVSIKSPVVPHLFVGMLFGGWMLATSLWTLSTTQVSKDMMLISYLLLMYLITPLQARPVVLVWTFRWIVIAGFLVAIIVLVGYITSGSLTGYGMFINEFYLTASSILGATAVGLAANLVTTKQPRVLQVVVLLVIFMGLALSLGRMALLTAVSLTIMIGFYAGVRRALLESNWRGLIKGIGIGVMVSLLAGGLLWAAMQVERTASRLSRLFGSLEQEFLSGGRGVLWSTAWENIAVAPVFGHGLGSSGILSSGSESYYPHNLLLQIWLDGGLIGVFLITVTLLLPIWFVFRRGKRHMEHLTLPFLAMYVFFILTYQTSSNAYTARAMILMGVLVTSNASLRGTKGASALRQEGNRVPGKLRPHADV